MKAIKRGAALLVVLALLGLTSCGNNSWRTGVVTDAAQQGAEGLYSIEVRQTDGVQIIATCVSDSQPICALLRKGDRITFRIGGYLDGSHMEDVSRE